MDKYEEEIPNFRLIISLLMKHEKIKNFDDVKIKFYKILLILFIFFLLFMLIDLLKLNFSVSIFGLFLVFDSSAAWFNFTTTISEIIFFSFYCITYFIQIKSEKFKLSFISRYVENKNFSLSELNYINNFIRDNYHVELIKTDYSIGSVIEQIDRIITTNKIKINERIIR